LRAARTTGILHRKLWFTAATMLTAATFDRERREVEAVLNSGIFNRAPNLAHLLEYVCAKYFEGASEEIKEYSIAVEAFSRPPEFDQKRDSIVRVEAHRLRRRLKEYYEDEGAGHEVQIEIPSGQYAPRFVTPAPPAVSEPVVPRPVVPEAVAVDGAGPEQSLVPVAEIVAVPAASVLRPASKEARKTADWRVSAAIVAVLAAAGGAFLLEKSRAHPAVPMIERNPAAPSGAEVRILCGAENGGYIDAFERTWQSDRYYQGGGVGQSTHNQVVLGTRDQQLYHSRREGQFRYDIPLRPGVYELHLYFAEMVFGDNNAAGGGETTRIFDVFGNGRPLLSQFDVIAEAGADTADIKVFKDIAPASDGKLHLEFRQTNNLPFINAIAVVPGMAGKIRPIRIVARDRGLNDSQGRYWDPDRYARGGQIVARPDSNIEASEPDLYRSERFGNLTYTIPVAREGRYGVNLYFAENWFGPGNPGGGGVGSRIFDILINGVALRRNFDILKEARGLNKPVVSSVHGVEPNHQDKIVISLIPARNYSSINALEVVDESK
jgi:Malectin domain